ncbi:MAG: decarboxylating 6-phosphogluconate dehydrogenase [Thermoleophilia bacterium]|nr:decarboxylating 6-phosphogluconate dehydrogenase [Thermoleophilia bacterium]
MRIAMMGLGRMGANMAVRLQRAGHEVVGFDRSPVAIAQAEERGIAPVADVRTLVASLDSPRVVWFMLPAAVTGAAIDDVASLLDPGDIVVDGGNGRHHDDISRAAALGARGIHYVDVGVSGGVWGCDRGYCLMVGGDESAIATLAPVLSALAPGVDGAPRTPGRTGPPTAAEEGWLHCGPVGSGHFVKMVHNGIEYGLMAAYAEGLNILHHADAGAQTRVADAETAPLDDERMYRYDIDVAAITELWRRGSVVGSWLLDLIAEQFVADATLEGFAGHVADSGEGRWALQAAIDEGVPSPVLAAALFSRFSSRGNDEFANKVLSAMRRGFGGHVENGG